MGVSRTPGSIPTRSNRLGKVYRHFSRPVEKRTTSSATSRVRDEITFPTLELERPQSHHPGCTPIHYQYQPRYFRDDCSLGSCSRIGACPLVRYICLASRQRAPRPFEVMRCSFFPILARPMATTAWATALAQFPESFRTGNPPHTG